MCSYRNGQQSFTQNSSNQESHDDSLSVLKAELLDHLPLGNAFLIVCTPHTYLMYLLYILDVFKRQHHPSQVVLPLEQAVTHAHVNARQRKTSVCTAECCNSLPESNTLFRADRTSKTRSYPVGTVVAGRLSGSASKHWCKDLHS